MTPESERLRALIGEEIERDGPIPFRRFMEQALYAPKLGYYTGGRTKIGKDGDFFTSLDLHPVFGHLVAAQIIEMSAAIPTGPYTVVEVGAGKGLLALDLLRTIQAAAPDLFARLRYTIIDVSPDLIQRQKKVLERFSDRVSWASDVAEIDGFDGVVVSNELVDSLPHHQVVMTGEGLREVFVRTAEDGFQEVLQAPSSSEIEACLQHLGITLAPGYRTEVNLDALAWMRRVGRALGRGHVLTIDYGYPGDVYYQSDRKKGTFLCYHRHHASEDPYSRVGLQDMTAHVDFSSLARAGREVGLEPVGFTDQCHFLVGLGITRLMETVLKRDGGDPGKSDEFRAMRRLMDPGGMGKAFKIMVQEKDVKSPVLSGLAFPALSVHDLFPNG